MANNQIIAEIKRVVGSHLGEADVMLFGSRAKGSFSDESDYDILIVTNDEYSVIQKIPLHTTVRKALLRSGIRSDILIQSRSEIEKKKKLPGHFIRNIMKESILI